MATLPFRRPAMLREPRPPEPPPVSSRQPAAPDEAGVGEDKRDRWWYESSYDLRSGLDVDDDAASTLPGDLIDQLFKR